MARTQRSLMQRSTSRICTKIDSYDNSSSYHGGSAVTTKHRMELCHERITESDMTDSTGRARKHARTQMQQDKNGALCYVLQTIWKFHNNMWQNSRNEILHLSPPMAKCIKESSIGTQVQAMYQHQQELAAADKRLFSLPLANRLCAKFYWLKLARCYHSTT